MVLKSTKPQKAYKKKSKMKPADFDSNKFSRDIEELNKLYKGVDKYINTPQKDKKLKTKNFY